MEPKNSEKSDLGNNREGSEGEPADKEMEKKRRVKGGEEHRRLILGLRLSRNRLHVLFKGHMGVVEHWMFRGTPLADNQWHTLVLAVSRQHVRLIVDCSSPQEM